MFARELFFVSISARFSRELPTRNPHRPQPDHHLTQLCRKANGREMWNLHLQLQDLLLVIEDISLINLVSIKFISFVLFRFMVQFFMIIQFSSYIISIALPYRESTTGGLCTALTRLNRSLIRSEGLIEI